MIQVAFVEPGGDSERRMSLARTRIAVKLLSVCFMLKWELLPVKTLFAKTLGVMSRMLACFFYLQLCCLLVNAS